YDALKKFQPSYLDSRIHFALNCGANSCPPITVFKVETIQKQLSNVTEGFLREETTVNESSNLISTTRLFLWYYNDFGKKAGILNILKDVFQLNESRWKIIYKPYDWRKNLGNFK
ncbi:MAG: DUF547 domain-containing protein, partial [Putridiphycobacter sp.]|nr:DUF547 domain-containing protein [Putridiphycobacter sp.]